MLKKIALFLFILLILFSLNLFADENLFKGFQLSYLSLDYLDVTSTIYGIELGLTEINPLAKWYIKNPPLTFAVHLALNIAIIKLTDVLFKENKKLGWVIIIGLNLIKGYVVYRNIRILWG